MEKQIENRVKLSSIMLEGFKSFGKKQEIRFGDVTIFIGANGSGKSNVLSFFDMIYHISEERLGYFTQRCGKADGLISKNSEENIITGKLHFKSNERWLEYVFNLEPNASEEFAAFLYYLKNHKQYHWHYNRILEYIKMAYPEFDRFWFPDSVAQDGQRKGGILGIKDCVMELKTLRYNKSFRNAILTTMYDFGDFNWKKENIFFENGETIQSKGEKAENHLRKETRFHDRFIPYFQMLQFESLLFSNPAVLHDFFENKESAILKLNSVLIDFTNNPEAIHSNNKPSYRIGAALGIPTKSLKGKTLATLVGKIGLKNLRIHCQHFDRWVTELEQIH